MRSSGYALLKQVAGILLLIPVLQDCPNLRADERPLFHYKTVKKQQVSAPETLPKPVMKQRALPVKLTLDSDSSESWQKNILSGKTESELSNTFSFVMLHADTDGDFRLSKKELTEAYYSPKIPEPLYSDILSMLLGFDQLVVSETSLISPESYINQSYRVLPARPVSQVDPVWNPEGTQDSVMTTLFPFGLASIRPEFIYQGNLGDCQFIAAVASLARTEVGKRKILRMFRHTGNNQLEVNLPDAARPVLIDLENTRDDGYAYTADGGRWLTYLEKALALYSQEKPVSSWYSSQNDTEKMLLEWKYREYRHMEGANVINLIPLLTGSTARVIDLTGSDSRKLARQLSEQFPHMELAITFHPKEAAYNQLSITRPHAYSLLAFDPVSHRITLRNPHGTGDRINLQTGEPLDGKDDGVFELTLEELRSLFDFIVFSLPEWYDHPWGPRGKEKIQPLKPVIIKNPF